MTMRAYGASTFLLLLALISPGRPLSGQTLEAWDPRNPLVTRENLEQLVQQLELTSESSTYGATLRRMAGEEAGRVRSRLRKGDFQVGDQILLTVEGEDQLSGTYVVRPGPLLAIPMLGDIPLEGTLRSELHARLEDHVGRFVRDPVVQVRSLIRVSISGEVNQPGFYVVSSEVLLSDAIMAAGGLSANADLSRIHVARGSERIWTGETLARALMEGQTLDQMGLHAGDQIVVAAQRPPTLGNAVRTSVAMLPPLLLLLTTILSLR
jgi:polysaccharide biosynthesis/export protein